MGEVIEYAISDVNFNNSEIGKTINEIRNQLVLIQKEIGSGEPGSLEFKTHIGTIKFSDIADYAPDVSQNKIQVSVKTEEFLTEKYSDNRNIDATDMEELSLWLVNFCEKNPQLLNELGIHDIHNLSPKQAILLTSNIVQENLAYPKHLTNKLDNKSIVKLLGKIKKGTCRNYAQTVKAIFDIFKDLQDPRTTQLNNTYCKQMSSFDSSAKTKQNAAQRNIVDNHRWNNFYTVLPSGEINSVVIDVAWTDSDGGEESYSKERFLFNLIDLVNKGLLTKNEQIKQLISVRDCGSLDQKSLQYVAISEYIKDYENNRKKYRKTISSYERAMKTTYEKNDEEKNDEIITKIINKDKIDEIINAEINADKIDDEKIDEEEVDNTFNNSKLCANISYFCYKKEDYENAIEFALKSLESGLQYETLLILVVSCIKNNTTEWKDAGYSLDVFVEHPTWFEKYSDELAEITKYVEMQSRRKKN